MQPACVLLSVEDYAVPALFAAAVRDNKSVFGQGCVHFVKALVDYSGNDEGRVWLHESCEQRAHADYDVCNDVRTHYVVAGAELTPQLRVVDDVAAVRGVVLMGEIVLFNVLGSGLYRVLENVAHRDLLSAEKQRSDGQNAASAAEVEDLCTGLHDILERFHHELCGVVLTCSERGSRVYLKDTVAGGGGDVLPGWLNYQGLSYAERLVVFLPVVRPILFPHRDRIGLVFDSLRAQGLAPTLEQNDAYREAEAELLRARGVSPEDVEALQAFAHKKAVAETDRATYQAMEAFIHNMNTIHSRGGNQVVFSSINYGTDTSAEGRCIIRELLKSTYRGVGNGETAIFPIQIWKKKRGVNYLPDDRNYDLYQLACQVTARRFFPNFLNLDATFNQSEEWKADDPKRYQHEVATMGCRTRVFENRFGPKTSIGRGNLSFSTINIVRLAIECMNIEDREQRIARFFAKLDAMLEVTARQLHERMEFQKTAFAKQFPLLMSALWIGCDKLKPNDTIASVINQGTLGIGFIGLAECLVALTGKHHGESEEAQELGLRIVSYMRDRANQFSEQYQHNYSVLATPAEGLSGKFTRKDRKDFGILPGITDRDYYTNSNHVPVYYKCSARHKAEIEGPYHDLTRGGHIFYVEMDGDATHNPEAISRVVDMMDRYNMGYGSVNHNRNRCLDCGYENAAPHLDTCPKCGSHRIDKLQRITGYLVGTTDRWNQAKLAELNDRVTHN